MKRLALLALLPLQFTACGPFFRGGGGPDPDALRLCVVNATTGYGNVVARVGLVRFTVLPGQEQCRPVTLTGAYLELRAVTTGGGVTGPLSYAERLQPGNTRCWRWRLSNARASAVDITPCGDDAPANGAR